MKTTSPNYLMPEIGQPLLKALTILTPHFEEIRDMWRQSMQSLELDLEVGDVDELACVILENHCVMLRTGKGIEYRSAMVRCGQSLDRRGVPPIHATIALSLYLEACCAFLLNANKCDSILAMALTHLNSVSQSLVIVGYAKEHSTNWLRLAKKERRRFSQDLHDEIGHNLIVLKQYLELMARDYKNGRTEDVIEKLDEAMALVSQSITSVRRLIFDLGPAVLDHLGLMPSFRVHAAQFSMRTGIKVEVAGNDILKIPRTCETALFRVFQGALSNVAKHSKAKNVQVTTRTLKGPVFEMSIEDNGVGFVPKKRKTKHTFGLTAMQERIERLGGQFQLTSRLASAKSRRSGTRINISLPIGSDTAEVER